MYKEYSERVQDIYVLALEKLNSINIYPSNNIEKISINSRAKKRLGCCKELKKGIRSKYEIEISSLLQDKSDEEIMKVMIHELLHTIPGCMNHGKKWKGNCNLVKEKLNLNITSTADYNQLNIPRVKQKNKYEITCQNCGLKMYRTRECKLTKRPMDYRCGKCKGTLSVKQIDE